ncbi:MAG: IS66 family insertion sequence element accessory protein TnpB [Methanobrevibacter woesei]|nr:IS66 family insertion sequence element accessory protein TnpB [Methanobrevibacter woesei]
MIDLSKVKNLYLYTSKVDMRFGIYAIQKRLALSFTPVEILGSIFIFISRDRKQVKIYYEDEYGSWLFINKMKYYKVQIESMLEAKEISKQDLIYLLKGVELKSRIEHQFSV